MRVTEATGFLRSGVSSLRRGWRIVRDGRAGRGVALAALLALAAGAARSQDWPMFQGDPQHIGVATSPIALPLTVAWRYVTARAIPGTNPSSPIVAHSQGAEPFTFLAARDIILSTRLDTGEPRWFYPSQGSLGAGRAATVRTTPLYANGILYVGATDGYLYALQANTGALIWQFPTPAQSAITASPIIVNDQIFFGTDNGAIIGLNARTGKPISDSPSLYQADDAVVGSLAYDDGYIYFVSRDQSAYCLDLGRALAPVEGRRRPRVIHWSYTLSAPPSFAAPVIRGDMLYLVDGDSLVALTTARGRRRWLFQADQTISDTPAVTDQGIFFGTKEGSFYGLDLDGKQVWKSATAGPVYSSPVVARVRTTALATAAPSGAAPNAAASGAAASGATTLYAVFVGSNRGFLYSFNTADGRPLWIYKIRPADPASNAGINVVASPVIMDSQLFAMADDGSLLAFSPTAVDHTPPLIWGEAPDRVMELSGRPPITYMVSTADDGSGINPDSIVMSVDGQKVDYTYDEYRGIVYYRVAAAKAGSREPVQPLPTGRHTVHVEVADWKGNKATRDWSFPVNNNISDIRPLTVTPGPGG